MIKNIQIEKCDKKIYLLPTTLSLSHCSQGAVPMQQLEKDMLCIFDIEQTSLYKKKQNVRIHDSWRWLERVTLSISWQGHSFVTECLSNLQGDSGENEITTTFVAIYP